MNYQANINAIAIAAHCGQQLPQQALAVIEDTKATFSKASIENYIIKPSEHDYVQIWDIVAFGLLNSSPWLKGVVEKYYVVDGKALISDNRPANAGTIR